MDLAATAGVEPRTIARWERAGLLPKSALSSDGRGVYAVYPPTAIAVVEEITALRARGVRTTNALREKLTCTRQA